MKKQGIYFLYLDEELIYIGKTINLDNRLKSHSKIGRVFNMYSFIEVENKSDMAILELSYIDRYKPCQNKLDNFDSESTFDIRLENIFHIEKISFSICPSTKQGYRRIYMANDGVYEKFMKSLSSSLEVSIAVDFMRDMDSNSVLKYAIAHYEESHSTSRSTVSKVFTKAKKFGLFKAAGRDIYVNPYVVLPYGTNDTKNHFLQRRWDLMWSESNKLPDGKLTKAIVDQLTIDLIDDIYN